MAYDFSMLSKPIKGRRIADALDNLYRTTDDPEVARYADRLKSMVDLETYTEAKEPRGVLVDATRAAANFSPIGSSTNPSDKYLNFVNFKPEDLVTKSPTLFGAIGEGLKEYGEKFAAKMHAEADKSKIPSLSMYKLMELEGKAVAAIPDVVKAVPGFAKAVGESIVEGVKAPGRALSGEMQDIEEMRSKSWDTLGLMGGGGVAMTPKGALGATGSKAFFSQLEKSLADSPTKSTTPDNWRKLLTEKGQVKPEEMKWSGVDELLTTKAKEAEEVSKLGRVLGMKPDKQFLEVSKKDIENVISSKGDTLKENWFGVKYSIPKEFADEFKQQIINDQSPINKDSVRRMGVNGVLMSELDRLKNAGSLSEGALANYSPEFVKRYKAIQKEAEAALNSSEPPRHASWTLPGGKDYKELVLSEPHAGKQIELDDLIIERVKPTENDEWWRHLQEWRAEHNVPLHAPVVKYRLKTDKEHLNSVAFDPRKTDADILASVRKDTDPHTSFGIRNKELKSKSEFTHQSHWGDLENPLVHMRMNDRIDADGKKVLHVEEVQSDWAQQGRKEGFADPDNPEIKTLKSVVQEMKDTEQAYQTARDRAYNHTKTAEYQKAYKEYMDTPVTDSNFQKVKARYFNEIKPGYTELVKHQDAAANRLKELIEKHGEQWKLESKLRKLEEGIPKAPFVEETSDWVTLAMKRMINHAAENGYDRITWTTGEQQIERYQSALRKQVDEIHWEKTQEGVHLKGYKGENQRVGMGTQAGVDLSNQAYQRLRVAGLSPPQANAEMEHLRNNWAEYAPGLRSILGNELVERFRPTAAKKEVINTKLKGENALSDSIGKAMSKQILDSPDQSGVIAGENITIDKGWPRQHYDRMMVDVANKLGKKHGVKVGKTKVPVHRGSGTGALIIRETRSGNFAVYRADGNNNTELVAVYNTRDNAQKALDELQEKAHAEVWSLDITPSMKSPAALFAKGALPTPTNKKDEKK